MTHPPHVFIEAQKATFQKTEFSLLIFMTPVFRSTTILCNKARIFVTEHGRTLEIHSRLYDNDFSAEDIANPLYSCVEDFICVHCTYFAERRW